LFALISILAGLPPLLAEAEIPMPYGIVQLSSLYSLLVAPVLYAGMSIVTLQIVRRRRVYFSDFFSGFYQYLPVLLVTQATVISHSNRRGLMRKPSKTQHYPGARVGGEHPDEAMSSKRWSTAFLP
jgi:hypothetical protein